MDQDTILALFRRSGALLEGHFQLSSGLHSSGYLQCALVLQHPQEASLLGAEIAARASQLKPEIVVSPALGGVVIGQEVARGLNTRAIFVERRDGTMVLRRGFKLQRGERVLVVEDVVTTGRSTRETIEVVRGAGAQVVGVGAIVNRGGPAVSLDVDLQTLVSLSLPTYKPQDCPLCSNNEPLVQPGSRLKGSE
jgi:orotate phosphoribosyltransferase